MTKYLILSFLLLAFYHPNHISAQERIEISEITISNLGDTQMYACKQDEAKTPLNGKTRIINGYTTEYFDAEFKDGLGTGKWEYYKNNKLTRILNFENGYLEGDYSELYLGGDIKEKGTYRKGQKHGKWESFKNDGTIKLTQEFEEGVMTKKIDYYTDGKINSEKNYKNGREHGIFKQYTWEGVLKSEKNYANGKQVGKQFQYYTSNYNDFTQISNYNENGLLHGDFEEIFAETKTIRAKGKYVKGQKDGKWIYGTTQKLNKEEIYKDGKLIETKKLD